MANSIPGLIGDLAKITTISVEAVAAVTRAVIKPVVRTAEVVQREVEDAVDDLTD